MEQTQYNLLFRWFIGLSMDDAVRVPTAFTKNHERLIEHGAVIELFNRVLEQAEHKGLLSGGHFSVGGTLIQAWAGHKSFVRKDGPDDDSDSGNFKDTSRSNDTHAAKATTPAGCATWATPSPTTATDWWPTPWLRPPMVLPSAKRPS